MHANLVMLVVILVKLMLLSSSYPVLSAVCLTKCSTYRNTCALCWLMRMIYVDMLYMIYPMPHDWNLVPGLQTF